MSPCPFPLLEAANRFGECVAMIEGEQQFTYSELLGATSRMASSLIDAGVQPGDRLCSVLNSTYQAVQAFWAIVGVGAVFCPISSRTPQRARDALVEQVRAARLLDAESMNALTQNDDSQEPLGSWPDYSDRRPATVMFSSGTTSLPKAVVHDARAHILNARGSNLNIRLEPGDRWLWSLPIHHVSGLSILFRCTLAGATLVVMPAQGDLAELTQRHRITHLSVVATQLKRLMDEDSSCLSRLKAVLLGGSALPRNLIETALKAGVPLRTTYGLTEMASQVATTTSDLSWDQRFTAGRILPDREASISAAGEIYVRGGVLCQGYLVHGLVKPVVDRDGWFHTGDLGKLHDGFLTVAGRNDNMFISGGENIHPEEIENCLLDLEGVRQAVVVPVTDCQYGHRPLAFVDADSINQDRILMALSTRLPTFKLPVAIRSWPKEAESSGLKPNRSLLKELAAGSD